MLLSVQLHNENLELQRQLADKNKEIVKLKNALEPFNREIRQFPDALKYNFSVTVHDQKGRQIFGLLASDFDNVRATLK